MADQYPTIMYVQENTLSIEKHYELHLSNTRNEVIQLRHAYDFDIQ